MSEPYVLAQEAMSRLRSSVYLLLKSSPGGLKNSEIGRSLGIYSGHVGHEGHISRTILALMEAEGVVMQDESTKAWRLRNGPESGPSDPLGN
ncbi:hypothetical protein IE4872_CH00492 [Rhizobium gallicum]|uniref:Helix-turn-helix domain-containing protein n=1 Tax=Rhizobium gallicum TaxID=56730 RepID=A0A1L5NE29_9HYPH|nr:hypothetical protein [Rhizobium gallicum]APO66157.1 hypothetical protein IE4872_CH00492 [Rhizobium gallicum]